MWLRFHIKYKIGVSIINSIPHCLTENDLKRGKNQEMWPRFYIEDKIGVSIIEGIPPCHTKFLGIAPYQSTSIRQCGIVSMISDSFFLYIEIKPNFLFLPIFKTISVWHCGILSMIDTPTLSSI